MWDALSTDRVLGLSLKSDAFKSIMQQDNTLIATAFRLGLLSTLLNCNQLGDWLLPL